MSENFDLPKLTKVDPNLLQEPDTSLCHRACEFAYANPAAAAGIVVGTAIAVPLAARNAERAVVWAERVLGFTPVKGSALALNSEVTAGRAAGQTVSAEAEKLGSETVLPKVTVEEPLAAKTGTELEPTIINANEKNVASEVVITSGAPVTEPVLGKAAEMVTSTVVPGSADSALVIASGEPVTATAVKATTEIVDKPVTSNAAATELLLNTAKPVTAETVAEAATKTVRRAASRATKVAEVEEETPKWVGERKNAGFVSWLTSDIPAKWTRIGSNSGLVNWLKQDLRPEAVVAGSADSALVTASGKPITAAAVKEAATEIVEKPITTNVAATELVLNTAKPVTSETVAEAATKVVSRGASRTPKVAEIAEETPKWVAERKNAGVVSWLNSDIPAKWTRIGSNSGLVDLLRRDLR